VLAVAGILAVSTGAVAQSTGATDTAASSQKTAADTTTATVATTTATPAKAKKTKTRKEDKVIQSKDTKKELRKEKKDNPLAGVDGNLPEKQLYDKAMAAIKIGHYDTARLNLQTLLNAYPDTEYQMRAKLAIADSWFKEGGTAALDQAESEYKDFITFFPNFPEAAEAQMRVGDIYFREMDKPDRDYVKAVRAQEEYRLMLQQFPDAPPELRAQAQQRLREVREALADGEREKAEFYAIQGNLNATIARYQTVVDTYPQYSHMDEALIGLGDAYEAEARYYRTQKAMPEAAKETLMAKNEGQAAEAYGRVVLEHSAAPHVEDAKDRLAAIGFPIPTPTPEQIAASVALESSRSQYTITSRAELLFMHKPDVVMAARTGDPTLTDPPRTLAPNVRQKIIDEYIVALNPGAARTAPAPGPQSAPETAAATAAPAAPTTAPAAPLQFEDVPTAAVGTGSSASVVTTPGPGSSTPSRSSSVGGLEIVSPSTPAAVPAAAADPNNPFKPVGPANAAALPPVEKAADAPPEINDIKPGSQQPAAPATAANGKKPKVAPVDKTDESSSKKKKKGLAKLNPF